MIADLKPYAEYKESGLPWLGQVPGHWEVVPSKSLFGHRKEKARKDDQMLTASQAHGIIARDEFMAIEGRRVMHVFTGADILKHVEPNDFVMSMRSFQGGLEWSKVRGAISSAYVMLIPMEHVHPPYYARLLKSTPYIVALRRTSDLVRDGQALRYANFGQVALPRVPKIEQATIVRFLDWANGRLERAIRAKRKVIALLNEQKQAIIHRAVIRGLDPSVPLKPSGIPWLGDIPQHWDVRRLKHLARFQSGDGITSMEIEEAGPYPVYGGNGLRGYTSRFTHEGHYALVGRQGALCGNINFANGQFFASEHAVVAALQPGMSVLWFGELLRVMNLNQYSQSAAQPGLAVERIKNLRAPVPPISEQKTIVERFERDTAPLAAAISRLVREIELLREYRTRLIADVVTGKLDVRAAAKLPEETDEPEVLDDADAFPEGDEETGDADLDAMTQEAEA